MGSHLVFLGLSHVYWECLLRCCANSDTITSFNP